MDYQLGPKQQYTLSQRALTHIITGDISERQEKDAAGNTVLTKILPRLSTSINFFGF